MPFKWDMNSSKLNEPRLGSNVQNGTQASFQSGGLGATTLDSNWGGRQTFMTQRGWTHQDISAPDKLVVPVDIAAPSYSWENRIANVYGAKLTGTNFLPLPGGYSPDGGTPRGGQVPQLQETAGTSTESFTMAEGSFNAPAPGSSDFFPTVEGKPGVGHGGEFRNQVPSQMQSQHLKMR